MADVKQFIASNRLFLETVKLYEQTIHWQETVLICKHELANGALNERDKIFLQLIMTRYEIALVHARRQVAFMKLKALDMRQQSGWEASSVSMLCSRYSAARLFSRHFTACEIVMATRSATRELRQAMPLGVSLTIPRNTSVSKIDSSS